MLSLQYKLIEKEIDTDITLLSTDLQGNISAKLHSDTTIQHPKHPHVPPA